MAGTRATLGPTTQRVVDYFAAFHAEHGRRPTMRQACEALGVSSPSTISHHLTRAGRLGVRVPGESACRADGDIQALAACVGALESCTPEGLRANLRYLNDRFNPQDGAPGQHPGAGESLGRRPATPSQPAPAVSGIPKG